MEWKLQGFPVTRKFHKEPNAGKILELVMWNAMGILMIDYFHCGQTITVDYYATLINNV